MRKQHTFGSSFVESFARIPLVISSAGVALVSLLIDSPARLVLRSSVDMLDENILVPFGRVRVCVDLSV